MLRYLNIKNLALLNEITLEFDAGFTAITGETGAGKSILIEALNLLSGARADKNIIRQGASCCEVEGYLYFPNPSPINALLEALHLPLCEENTLILKRCIDREKSPKIQINGSFALLSSLQKLGEFWIDFHRIDEPQKLFESSYQLQIVDLYGGLTPLLTDYKALYFQWKNLLKQIVELSENERLSDDEIHFYQTQINKINAINPTEELISELEQNFTRISHAQEIGLLSSQLEAGLTEEFGIQSSLQELMKPAFALSKLLPSTNALLERLNSLIIETEDIASEYGSINSSLETDPELIQETQRKMNDWHEIKRQYGPNLESVLKKRKSLEEKVSLQSNIENTLEQLSRDAKEKELNLAKLADMLQQKRHEAVIGLTAKVQKLLKTLGFEHAKLEIKIHNTSILKEYGNCYIEFLFAANKGHPLMPLHKIASSGETARVMLALKTILAEVDQTTLLVFDEIDANIGGEVASKVANALKMLSKNHQVMCVTHLPQTAAQAHNHYTVYKESSSNETSVTIMKLTHPQERIQELARMFGNRACESALSHAKDLLTLTEMRF